MFSLACLPSLIDHVVPEGADDLPTCLGQPDVWMSTAQRSSEATSQPLLSAKALFFVDDSWLFVSNFTHSVLGFFEESFFFVSVCGLFWGAHIQFSIFDSAPMIGLG